MNLTPRAWTSRIRPAGSGMRRVERERADAASPTGCRAAPSRAGCRPPGAARCPRAPAPGPSIDVAPLDQRELRAAAAPPAGPSPPRRRRALCGRSRRRAPRRAGRPSGRPRSRSASAGNCTAARSPNRQPLPPDEPGNASAGDVQGGEAQAPAGRAREERHRRVRAVVGDLDRHDLPPQVDRARRARRRRGSARRRRPRRRRRPAARSSPGAGARRSGRRVAVGDTVTVAVRPGSSVATW